MCIKIKLLIAFDMIFTRVTNALRFLSKCAVCLHPFTINKRYMRALV